MKYVMCSVFDKAVGAFNTPLSFRSRAEAVRSFTAGVQKDPAFLANPSDYSFHQVAVFDDATGAVASEIVRLIEARDCIVVE